MEMSRGGRSGHFAAGPRVEIREGEWHINWVDHASDSACALLREGLSELVRGRAFLSRLKTYVQPLDRERVQLMNAASNDSSSLLYINSLLRQSTLFDARLRQSYKNALGPILPRYQSETPSLAQPGQPILVTKSSYEPVEPIVFIRSKDLKGPPCPVRPEMSMPAERLTFAPIPKMKMTSLPAVMTSKKMSLWIVTKIYLGKMTNCRLGKVHHHLGHPLFVPDSEAGYGRAWKFISKRN